MITLSDGITTLALHKDLYWSDENAWNPVEQTKNYTLTGSLIVMSAARKAGRPITLASEDDTSAWMLLSDVTAIRNWAAAAGKVLTLTLRGVAHSVVFRHEDGSGFSATPIQHTDSTVATDFYLCTLRFTEL